MSKYGPRTIYFTRTLHNSYLNETKIIKGKSVWELDAKEQQVREIWSKKESSQRERDRVSDLKAKSELMSLDAAQQIGNCRDILRSSLGNYVKLNWDNQFRQDSFRPFSFDMPIPLITNTYDYFCVPKKSFLEIFFKSLKNRREDLEKQANDEFMKQMKNYEDEKAAAENAYQIEKLEFENEKELYNQSIAEWKTSFAEGKVEAIERYISAILDDSNYPYFVPKDVEVQYIGTSKAVVISFFMPKIEDIPNISGYKYIAAHKTIKTIELKKKEIDQLYEDIIHQIALRTINEVFRSMYLDYVEMVVFNAWVEGVDKSKGTDFTSCILSVQVTKEEFEQIDLNRIEPKDCIRSLKGLYSGPLAQLSPVKPYMDINREDKRFVESKEVLADINSTDNLAEMPWEDFEHLVRELFSKIFSKDDAEVKVTQASRDGGVDAIVFDPDPIRGGKFVIQAKRYNNVVPVSAVRDLYGTMINEGAVKGILVTTSYYGNDSREFAKGKPITLIDGQQLIYMFQEYGHKVRIELQNSKVM